MKSNEERMREVLAYVLKCGYLDITYLINQERELDLDLTDAIDDAFNEFDTVDCNLIILMLQRQYITKICDRFIVELEEDVHYSIYQNCLDSHIYPKEDAIIKSLGHDSLAEIIIAEINKW